MKSFIIVALIGLFSFGSKAQEIFINMPNLDKTQGRLLLEEMLKYREQKKDSVNTAFYTILGQIQSFIDNPNIASQTFQNVPLKIVDFIEKDIFQGSIMNWDLNNDNDKRQLQIFQNQSVYVNKSITDLQSRIAAKILFRCGYYAIIGLDCPPTPQN